MPGNRKTAAFDMVLDILNAGDCAFLKSILDGEGIDYFIQGETVAPYIFHSVPMRLMVRRDQVQTVRDLLDRFERSSAYGGLKKMIQR